MYNRPYDRELEILKLRDTCAWQLLEARLWYLRKKVEIDEDFAYLHLRIHDALNIRNNSKNT